MGSSLGLDGRLQSRTYTKNLGDRVEERTAFEVSIMNLLPWRRSGWAGRRPSGERAEGPYSASATGRPDQAAPLFLLVTIHQTML